MVRNLDLPGNLFPRNLSLLDAPPTLALTLALVDVESRERGEFESVAGCLSGRLERSER